MINQDKIQAYDNNGDSYDRYSFVLNGCDYMLSTCDNPDHPLGYSQFFTCINNAHLGKPIEFNSLPEKLKNHVLARFNS